MFAVVAAAGTGLRWWDPWDSRATFDTLQYARVAFRYEGQAAPDALVSAVQLRCREWARVRAAPSWVPVSTPRPAASYAAECARPGYVPRASPRYQSIFDARPGYPLAVAALAPALGSGAFAAVAVMSGAFSTFLVGVAALLLGVGRWPSVVAAVTMLLLPTGLYLTRLGPDGLVGLGVTGAVCGALLVVRHRRPAWGTVLLGGGLLLLIPVKLPVAVALGASLAVTAAWAAFRTGPPRGPAVLVAVVGAGAVSGALLTGKALRWAGLRTTLEDLATHHFSRPLVANPYRLLVREDVRLVGHTAPAHLGVYLVAALAAVALFGLARRGLSGRLVVAAGASGILLIAVHPVATEAARLAVPLWVAVGVGVAAAVDRIPRRGSG